MSQFFADIEEKWITRLPGQPWRVQHELMVGFICKACADTSV